MSEPQKKPGVAFRATVVLLVALGAYIAAYACMVKPVPIAFSGIQQVAIPFRPSSYFALCGRYLHRPRRPEIRNFEQCNPGFLASLEE